MADGSVIIDTQIDTSGASKGAKSLQSILDKVSKNASGINTLANTFTGLKSAISLASGTLSTIKKGFDTVAAAIDDVTEAYKTQAKAEAQLTQAAKNNPYLNTTSVASLKRYASELQEVSNVGDEQLIPMMARLAASGRTQEEIQQTMAAALDLSASGAMSLDSAVDALNKTYAGTTGQLGRTLPEIASLTDAELAQGKAVEVVAQKYKGMAAAIADTKIQAANAKGDFKEAVGALTAPSVDAWNKFWKGFYNAATDALKGVKQALDALTMSADNKAFIEEMEATANWSERSTAELERYLELKKTQLKLDDEELEAVQNITAEQRNLSYELLMAQEELNNLMPGSELYEDAQARVEELEDALAEIPAVVWELTGAQIDAVQAATAALDEQRTAAEKEAAAEEERTAQAQRQAELQSKLNALAKEYDDAVAAKQRELEVRRQMGEAISAEAEAEELLSTKTQGYLKLASGYSELGVTLQENNRFLQDVLETSSKLTDEQAALVAAQAGSAQYEEALSKIEDTLGDIVDQANELLTGTAEDEKLSATIENTIALLEAQKEAYSGNSAAVEEYEAKIEELSSLLQEVTSAEARDEIEAFRDTLKSEGEASLSVYERLLQEKEALAAEYNEKMSNEALAQAGYTEEQIYQIQQEYADKMAELNGEMAEAQNERVLAQIQEIASYAEQTASIVESACDVMIDAIETEADEEKEELAEKYEQGLISQEEYEAGIEAIEEAAAMKEYKIEMANWTAQLLEAAASVALGCARSLEKGMPQGAILAALTSAAGAVQIAAITAAKPQKPSFSQGGIVPGSSYSGDNVEARVNSGEMVLTREQQANLFNMANGMLEAQRNTNYPITINNTQSDKVRASARADSQGVTIDIVDGFVQHRIASGAYDGSFKSYESVRNGKRYL